MLLSLGAGFALGLVFCVPEVSPVSPTTGSEARAQPPAPPVSRAEAQVKIEKLAPPPTLPEGSAWTQRSETLRWLQEVGVPMRLNAFQGREPSKALVRFLELTPTETTAITAAIQHTGAELDRLRGERATSRTSEDGTHWVVEMPAIDAASSGAIYDALHGTLRATLGEERFALLDVVAGESLERAYDRYGLNDVRYEVNLQPKPGPTNGEPVHDYKRHTVEAGGQSTGWSGGATTLTLLARQDPLLERLLPPAAGAASAK